MVAGSWEAEERQGAGGIPVDPAQRIRCGGDARSRSTADGRGAGHRLCPYSPLAKSFLTRKIDEPTTFDSADLRTAIPRFTPEARGANQALA